MLTLRAPAKINLTLEVLGKRKDGYHEVRTVMQTIDLQDVISFQPNESLNFVCSDASLLTGDNTIVAAAMMLREKLNFHGGATIELLKVIPASAGLGGGSTDGAATLAGLNQLWKGGLSTEELVPLALKLGSDVPFFLYGGTALAEGRGEKITPLVPLSLRVMVLLVPPIVTGSGKTARLYGSLKSSHYTRGEFSERAVEEIQHGRIPKLFNVFESVAFDLFPGLKEYWQSFEECGASEVHLAGSGPVLFALAHGEKEAGEISGKLRRQGLTSHVAHTTGPGAP